MGEDNNKFLIKLNIIDIIDAAYRHEDRLKWGKEGGQ